MLTSRGINQRICDTLESFARTYIWHVMLVIVAATLQPSAFGQLDEGAITGTVTDSHGAVVPRAPVVLTNIDTNLKLQTLTDGSGFYAFQPIKAGAYSVTVAVSGFSTTVKDGLQLHVSEHLEANVTLQPGAVSQTVVVNAGETPLLQTQEASTGQVMTTSQINDAPLSGRNYVFIAQLAAGVAPSNGGRGQGNGDFNANGQRETQNNFILDGVDNNSNAIDFLNGASYVVKPPPDALEEFKVQTGSFAAEFGHSAGAAVNASIKSGGNEFHGDLWEYLRNSDLTAVDWTSTSGVLPYHQNQFGGTFGGPILKNKLFFFGDYEGTRIVQGSSHLITVPTAKERNGNFTELLNPSLTGDPQPVYLYEPGSAGTAPLGSACGNPQNVMCPSEFNSIAKNLLSLYPQPSPNNPNTYNNLNESLTNTNYTNAFDTRVDWNIDSNNQIFGRVSWSHQDAYYPPLLGSVLDGGAGFADGTFKDYGKNAVFSFNHIFSPTLTNQARFAYNWGDFGYLTPNYNTNISAQYGLGGVPYSPGNGGFPNISISGINTIGTPTNNPTDEHEDVYQIVDDLTKIVGSHTLKLGVDFQNIRYSVFQPGYDHLGYTYNGTFTGSPGVAYTGSGVADFLADYMNAAHSSTLDTSNLGRWYRSAYAQDDWKVNSQLTMNLGLRYDFYQPPIEHNDHQAAFYPTTVLNVPAAGTGVYELPQSQKSITLDPHFLSLLSKDNIQLQYTANRELVLSEMKDFAPRFGITYLAARKLVIRTGSGFFYGGAENLGNYPNLAVNYPFDIEQAWSSPSCVKGQTSCQTDGASLVAGPPSGGLSLPSMRGQDHQWRTPYSISYNLSTQYVISNNTSFTAAYVGSQSRHLQVVVFNNGSAAIAPAGTNTQQYAPFPDFGTIGYITPEATGNYNSLQLTLERHWTDGLSFLSTYTWAHSLDDSREPLPDNGDGGNREYNIFGIRPDYSSSPFDVRHRFSFYGTYDLPFGKGRKYLTEGGWTDVLAGGWSTSLLFRAQTGQPFTVGGDSTTVAGSGTHPILISNPFKAGGSPPANNPNITCPSSVKNRTNWYNPCAFSNATYPTSFGPSGYITGASNALPYVGGPRNQIYNPGFGRIDMTVFKNWKTVKEQSLQFRTDIFNLFNTPTWGSPSNTGIQSNGGLITGSRFLSNYAPDARFFQLALKYYF